MANALTDWFKSVDTLSNNRPLRRAYLLDELRPYWERWSATEFQQRCRPLRITMDIHGVLAGYNPLSLDNLLARLLLDRVLGGAQLDNEHSPYLLPAPLKIVWRHPQTSLPLYASNQFEPVGHDITVAVWWHKRFVRPEHVTLGPGVRKGDIQPNQGRYKEKRVPMPARTAARWQADCIGDAEAIADLLQDCARVGKRRLALVEQWTIAPVAEFSWSRPVPVAFLAGTDREHGIPLDMRFCGWTPPYWPGVPEAQAWCAVPPRDDK